MTTQQYIRGRWSRFGPTDGFDEDVVLNPDWGVSDLSDAVRQGLVLAGNVPPPVSDDYVDGQLFVTEHSIYRMTPAAQTMTNTLSVTITPVTFGATLPSQLGVHRAIGTVPAAGAMPASVPAGILGFSYNTMNGQLAVITNSELITRQQSWGIAIDTGAAIRTRYNLRYSAEGVIGGTTVYYYTHSLDSAQMMALPFVNGTAVTFRLIAPTNLFTGGARHWAHYLDVNTIVHTDATIAGANTESDPLRVARPFTDNDERLVDSIRYEGRERWTGTITIGTSTSPQWGSSTVLRGFADTAEPVTHTGDSNFGSLSDNTDGANRAYRMYYNGDDDEFVLSIANDPDLSNDVFVVDGQQLHFSVAEKLPPADTGGAFTLYTWRAVPAVLQGSSASYAIIEPLEESDYVPDTGTGYLNRTSGGALSFKQVDYSEIANAPTGGGGTGTPAELETAAITVNTATVTQGAAQTWTSYVDIASYTMPAGDDQPFLMIADLNPSYGRDPRGGGDRILIDYNLQRTRGAATVSVADHIYYPRFLPNFTAGAPGTPPGSTPAAEDTYRWHHHQEFLDRDAMPGDVYTLQARTIRQSGTAINLTWNATNTTVSRVFVTGGGASGSVLTRVASTADVDVAQASANTPGTWATIFTHTVTAAEALRGFMDVKAHIQASVASGSDESDNRPAMRVRIRNGATEEAAHDKYFRYTAGTQLRWSVAADMEVAAGDVITVEAAMFRLTAAAVTNNAAVRMGSVWTRLSHE